MTINDRSSAAQALLHARGANNMEHPGGTLFAHLGRVRTMLAEWGADEDVQLAGLCHAAYGTDGFAVALLALNERPVLAEAIGRERSPGLPVRQLRSRADVPAAGAPGR